MILTTPGGKPAASMSLPRRKVVPGVNSLGFTTQVHPAANANGNFWLMIEREIPRCDHSNNPDRLPKHEADHRIAERVVSVAADMATKGRRIFPESGTTLHFSARLGDRFAALQYLNQCQLLGVCANRICDTQQKLRTFCACHVRPRTFIEGPARSGYRCVGIGLFSQRISSYQRFVGGTFAGKLFPAMRSDPTAVDPH